MMYHSLTNTSIRRTFSEALREGLAPDRGLYVPEQIPELDWEAMHGMNLAQLGAAILAPLVTSAISRDRLEIVLGEALNFPIPLKPIAEELHMLELFHGPTAAFKDVGARVMSRLLGETSEERLTVLVATSGDTGSAVAQGFFNVPNIDVVILYPSGRISYIQEQQLTTVGENVVALEIDGAFDDCQSMVKEAFLDQELQKMRPLTSANSINIGRWMPQAIYFAWATIQAGEALNFVVPSGNFGNIAAGVLAARMGMPARKFVAAVNANDGMAKYLKSGQFTAKTSIQTCSNAMDVGDPSNRPRLEWLLGPGVESLRQHLSASGYSDARTLAEMKAHWKRHQSLVCPHTAVGLCAIADTEMIGPTAVLATADAAKFGDVVQQATGEIPAVPHSLQGCLDKKKSSVRISGKYSALKAYLLDSKID